MWADIPRKDTLPDRKSLGIIEDNTDYDHRGFVNLLATVALLTIAICVVWTVKAIQDNERLEACVFSGRPDCIEISETAPKELMPFQ